LSCDSVIDRLCSLGFYDGGGGGGAVIDDGSIADDHQRIQAKL
jgi:hypothetical protein